MKTRSFDEAESHIARQIERIEGEASELKEKIDNFEALKINETREQKTAQRSITPKLVKKTYKYLKTHRDEIIIELMETYVACLRNKFMSGPLDVELYLRTKKGLDVAMNQVEPANIKGENARRYIDVIGQIRNNFKEGSKYVTYIPFLVWLNKTCHLIKWAIDEKKLVEEYDAKMATVANLKALVDEIDALKDENIPIDSHDFQGKFNKIKLVKRQFENTIAMLGERIDSLADQQTDFRHKFMYEADNTRELSGDLHKFSKEDKAEWEHYQNYSKGSPVKGL